MRKFTIAPWAHDENQALTSVFGDLEKMLHDVTRPWSVNDSSDTWLTPRIDVAETSDALEVTAEMPGVAEKDIDVQLDGRTLTLRAEKSQSSEKEGKTYRHVERSYGSFSRSFTLPFAVDSSKVEATFKDGVLALKLPKPAEAIREVKKIPIKH